MLRRLQRLRLAITVVYALILPNLLLVPKHLTGTADGQSPGFKLDQVEPVGHAGH